MHIKPICLVFYLLVVGLSLDFVLTGKVYSLMNAAGSKNIKREVAIDRKTKFSFNFADFAMGGMFWKFFHPAH